MKKYDSDKVKRSTSGDTALGPTPVCTAYLLDDIVADSSRAFPKMCSHARETFERRENRRDKGAHDVTKKNRRLNRSFVN